MTELLYFLNVAFSTGQSTLGRQYAVKGGSANNFNINQALSGTAVFLIVCVLSGFTIHLPTFLFGALYGVFLCLSMYTGFKALAMGPLALTSIIASFSLIIPFIFGITVWSEPLTLLGVISIILLLSAIVLMNLKKEGGVTLKWLTFALLTLLTKGVCSIIQKFHQLYYPKQYQTEFMLFALACVFVMLSVAKSFAKGKGAFKFSLLGLFSGLLNGGTNYIVLYLAATEKASVLFPVVSVAKVIAVGIVGRIIYKERLKPLQITGIACGLTAIVLLNIK